MHARTFHWLVHAAYPRIVAESIGVLAAVSSCGCVSDLDVGVHTLASVSIGKGVEGHRRNKTKNIVVKTQSREYLAIPIDVETRDLFELVQKLFHCNIGRFRVSSLARYPLSLAFPTELPSFVCSTVSIFNS